MGEIPHNNIMTYQIPKVGSKIRVVIRHKNHYYLTAESNPFIENVYEGVVIPSEKWDQPFTFNMTGDKIISTRNIAVNNIIKMEIVGGAAAKLITTNGIRAFKVKSKKNVYTVIKNGPTYSCTCIGFQYYKRCRHISGVHAKVTK